MGRRNKSTSTKFNKDEEKPLTRNQLRKKEKDELKKGLSTSSKTTTPKVNKDYSDSDDTDTDTDITTTTTTTTTTTETIVLSLDEILFWKVWKNIVLQTHILSIVSTRDKETGFQPMGVFKYNEIVSVQWMLKYGHFELLKLKVRNNDHLMDFYEILNTDATRYNYIPDNNDQQDTTTTTTSPTTAPDRYSIFKLIQNDNEFYENLYSNYSDYFIKIPQELQYIYNFPSYSRNVLKIKDYYNEFEYSLMESLKHDNISSYSVLDRNFNYNYGVDGLQTKFYEAVNYGSIKVAKYLYKKLFKVPRNEICSKVWKDCTFFKSLLGQEDHKHFKLVNKIVKFLIQDLKLIPPREMKITQDIFEIDIKSITVGELYESCFTVALLLENTQFFSDFIKLVKKGEIIEKYQGFPDAVENYLPNPSLDFLKVEQLNEILSNTQANSLDEFVYQQTKSNSNIYKLVKMLIPFSSYAKSYKNNFIYYSCKYTNDYSLIGKSFNPLLFGQMKTILEFQTSNLPTLFKYCENEQEIQNQFINSMVQNIIVNIDNERQLKMKPSILVKLLLDIDRLDLIEIVIDKLLNESNGKIKSTTSSLLPLDFIGSIKSIKTFDYFMSNNQLKQVVGESFTLVKCLNSNGLNLMNHIKLNHPLFYKGLLSSINVDVVTPISYSLESLLFIYNNINDFQHCYERIEIWKRVGSNWNFTLDQFIQLVNGTPYNRNYTFLNSNDILEITLSQLHWIKLNRPSDLISKRCIPELGEKSSNTLSIYDYFSGNFNSKVIEQLKFNFDQVSPILPNNNYFRIVTYNSSSSDSVYLKIRHYIAKYGDTKSLDSLMKLFNLDENLSMTNSNRNNCLNQFYSGFITPLLRIATINGRLSIFYFIKIKYPWIFSSKPDIDQDPNRIHYYLISSLFSSIAEIASTRNYIELLFLLKTLFFKEFLTQK